MIAALALVERKDDLGVGESGFGERVTSLSMTPNMPESAKFEGKDITETDFFNLLEALLYINHKAADFLHAVEKDVLLLQLQPADHPDLAGR